MKKIGCFLHTFFALSYLHAQVDIHGTVYKDFTKREPVDSVPVYIKGGQHLFTDWAGNFKIRMSSSDTLCLYYLNKLYLYYPTSAEFSSGTFDIFLDDSTGFTTSYHSLIPVTVKTNSYTEDSLKRRKEYEQVFEFRADKISMGNNKWHDSIPTIGGKVPKDTRNKKLSLLNVTSLAHAIKWKKKKQTLALQKRLVKAEQIEYVEHEFTPALVEKYSGMHDDDSLKLFIQKYAPTYDDLVMMNELDKGMYILKNIRLFRGTQVSDVKK